MADLKTTIAQTENLKNKVKLAKDRINETVVRGGITSKSLSEIPDNIKSMISKNYKKVAFGRTTINEKENLQGFYIPLNLAFMPTRVVANFENVGLEYISGRKNLTLDTGYNNGKYEQDRTLCKISLVDSTKFKVIFRGGTIKGVCNWIAIE